MSTEQAAQLEIEEIHEHIVALEAERLRIYRQRYPFVILGALTLSIPYSFLLYEKLDDPKALASIPVIALFGYFLGFLLFRIVCSSRHIEEAFEDGVIRKVIEGFHNSFRHHKDEGIEEDVFCASKLTHAPPHSYISKDLIQGQIQDLSFEWAKIYATYKTMRGTSHKQLYRWHPLLVGDCMLIEAPRPFRGHTVVRTHIDQESLLVVETTLEAWASAHEMQSVVLDDSTPDLQEQCVIHSTAPDEARTLLTPVMCQWIAALHQKHADVRIAFLHDKIYLAYKSTRYTFDVNVYHALDHPELIQWYRDNLQEIKATLEELAACIQSWTKE